jgi:oligopeptide transport system permease protein
MMSKKDFKFVKKESNLDLEQTRVSLTYWQDVWRRLKKNKMAMFGLLIVISIVLFAIFGPLFTKFDYKDQELLLRNLPPKLDVYEVEDNVFIHRTEAYNLIEFNKDGYVVDLLQQVTIDEANDIYYYSYVKEFEYLLVEGGEFPLPDGVTFEPDTFYSEVWGIALTDVLTDVLTDDGDNQVIINYVHPDSPFLAGNQTNGSVAETIEGLVVDQFVFTDDISNPELADNYTIKSSRTALFMILDMEKTLPPNTEGIRELKGKLAHIKIFSEDILVLDFGLRGLDPSERPEGYEDVEYIITYKGKETTKITDTFSNKTYPWGTDFLGRDVLTRVMYGARISLLVALIATLVNFLIGITFGSISGFFGGNVDNVMMRIVDIINSIPLVLYVILLMVVLREVVIDVDIFGKNRVIFNGADGFTTIIIALGSVYWTGMARLVRGQVLSLKEQEYVLAARTIGVSNRKIIYRHLIPNALGPIIVSMTMMIPSAVFTEAFLSFIGIGVSAPQASWGTLANEALGGITRYTYQLVYPSMAIAITMLGFNFLGDGLRDALDPRLRKG